MSIEHEVAEIERAVGRLAKLLPEKARAYGGAHNRQAALWRALLEAFPRDGDGNYILPPGALYIMPRVTRILDRLVRIVSNAGEPDALGEEPWLDLAGDAIAGAAMPKRDGRPASACEEPGCEVFGPHDVHAKFDAAGLSTWTRGRRSARDAQPSPAGFDPELDIDSRSMDDTPAGPEAT